MSKIEYKRLGVSEIKASEADDGRFYIEGYASVFGNVDSYKDVVDAGAFSKTIVDDFDRIRFCKDHNLTQVIGKIMPGSLVEDNYGLKFRARLGRTTLAKDVMLQIEDGELDELSIGYIPLKYYNDYDDQSIRHLSEVKLIDLSIVGRAANDKAIITMAERKSQLLCDYSEFIRTCSDDELIAQKQMIANEYYKRILTKIK